MEKRNNMLPVYRDTELEDSRHLRSGTWKSHLI